MKFKEGDKVIYDGREVEIIKPLPNSNRYKIKTEYTKSLMVNEEFIFNNLKEYHEDYIKFAEKKIIQAKERYLKTKQMFERKIKESKEFLK